MTDYREKLIEAGARARYESNALGVFADEWGPWDECDQITQGMYRADSGISLDALLAHPRELLAVLAEQRVPCPTCGGTGTHARYSNREAEHYGDPCPDCEDGTVPLDLARLLCDLGVLEQVGWLYDSADGGLGFAEKRITSWDRPVFARRSQEGR